MFATVIPTSQYNLTNDELYECGVASASLGTPNPVCIPHIGARLVRAAPEEDVDDADAMRRGDTVDPFGFHVSARPQQGGSWKERHDKLANYVTLVMQLSGVSTKVEPRNLMNRLVPQRLLRDPAQGERANLVLQGAVQSSKRGVYRPQ